MTSGGSSDIWKQNTAKGCGGSMNAVSRGSGKCWDHQHMFGGREWGAQAHAWGEVGELGSTSTCLGGSWRAGEQKHMPGGKLESWGSTSTCLGGSWRAWEHEYMPGCVWELRSTNTR